MGRKKSDISPGVILILIGLALVGMIFNWASENPVPATVIGIFIGVIIVAVMRANAKEAEERRAAQLAIQREKEEEKLRKLEEKEAAKRAKEEEKLRKQQEREAAKRAKEEEKLRKQQDKEALKSFTIATVQRHGLGKSFEAKIKSDSIDGEYDLEYDKKLVKKHSKEFFKQICKVKSSDLDDFLLSGEYNSVLGLDGFKIFKDQILQMIEGHDDPPSIDIDINKLKEILFISGIYFEYNGTSKRIREIEDKYEWRGFQRLILTKEPEIRFDAVNVDKLKEKNPSYFSSYTNGDSESLTIALESIVVELHPRLSKFLNSVRTISNI